VCIELVFLKKLEHFVHPSVKPRNGSLRGLKTALEALRKTLEALRKSLKALKIALEVL